MNKKFLSIMSILCVVVIVTETSCKENALARATPKVDHQNHTAKTTQPLK